MRNIPLFVASLALAVAVLALLRIPSGGDAFAAVNTTNARAGVYGYCDAVNGTAHIISKFNNRNQRPIFISVVGDPEVERRCVVTFPFKTANRLTLATLGDNRAGFVSVGTSFNSGQLPNDVFVTLYAPDASVMAGAFHLIVY